MVLARIYLLSDYSYLSQFVIAGILLFVSSYFLKTNYRAGLGLILVVFTSIYYDNTKFTIFALSLYVLFAFSLYYLRTDKKEILKSFILGIVSSIVSYYFVKFLF
jgi:hypothetical protein